jgi:SAM-dependent methyltransferase
MIEKYSKSSESIREIKSNFVQENGKHLREACELNQFYTEQEPRSKCKNCEEDMGGVAFKSFGVPYGVCDNCGHLNGAFEDSEEFTKYLYEEEKGKNYKDSYTENYDKRVSDIYLPKVDFLKDVVGECKVNDVGCGAGHFLKACEYREIEGEGIDPNMSLVNIGRSQLRFNRIYLADPEEFERFIEGSKSVVSMIGVLEHLREPNRAIEAFNRSQAEYLYISVPLLSPSVFIEHSFPSVFPRHLRGAHTHLYTKQSLEYMADRHNLEIEGQWWFGSDMMDLYRSMRVRDGSLRYQELLKEYIEPYIDELQAVLDKNKVCSEVHLIYKKK